MQKFHAGTRRQFDELRQQLDAEISAILTPEQRAKFEERRTQRRERRPSGERGPGEPPGPPR
jgi:Spy/CpxP family protein refolding chaperone